MAGNRLRSVDNQPSVGHVQGRERQERLAMIELPSIQVGRRGMLVLMCNPMFDGRAAHRYLEWTTAVLTNGWSWSQWCVTSCPLAIFSLVDLGRMVTSASKNSQRRRF